MEFKLSSLGSGSNTKTIVGVDKSGRFAKLSSGEVVSIEALKGAIGNKLITVKDDANFDLASGTRMFRRQDGLYGFTGKEQASAKIEF